MVKVAVSREINKCSSSDSLSASLSDWFSSDSLLGSCLRSNENRLTPFGCLLCRTATTTPVTSNHAHTPARLPGAGSGSWPTIGARPRRFGGGQRWCCSGREDQEGQGGDKEAPQEEEVC